MLCRVWHKIGQGVETSPPSYSGHKTGPGFLVQRKLSGLLKASDYSQLDLTGKDLKGILADVGIYRRRP